MKDFNGSSSIFIWKKAYSKDVGHTAIKVDNFVFGFYPTDENQNGVYDMEDLAGSTGEMHIDSMNDFNQIYINNGIHSYGLNISNKQAQDLVLNLINVYENPPKYELSGSHCTTVAARCLRESGILLRNNPNLSGSAFIPGFPPTVFQSIIELNANKSLIKNHSFFIVK